MKNLDRVEQLEKRVGKHPQITEEDEEEFLRRVKRYEEITGLQVDIFDEGEDNELDNGSKQANSTESD